MTKLGTAWERFWFTPQETCPLALFRIAFGVVVTLLAGIALTIGYHTRLAGWVVFLGVLSFQRRNPDLVNAGDGLLCNLALYCALAPAGVALSLDRIRTAPGRFWEFPARAPWTRCAWRTSTASRRRRSSATRSW